MTGFTAFVETMNFAQLNLLFIACLAVFVVVGLFVLERVWASANRKPFNEIILGIMQVLGTIFAILVGTIIVSVWSNFDSAKKITMAEAGNVGDLYRQINNIPGLDTMRPLLLQYAEHVIHSEWPEMKQGMKPTSGWNYLFQMQHIINQHKDKDASDHTQTMLTQLFDNRRLRIASTESYLPSVVYTLMFFLSFFLLFFSFLVGTKSVWFHVFLCIGLAIALSLTLTTVIAVDSPYRTQIHIQPTDMKTVLYNLQHLTD